MADVVGSAYVEILPRISARFQQETGRAIKQPLEKAGAEAGAAAGKATGKTFSSGLSGALATIGAAVVVRQVGAFFKSTIDAALEFESAFAGVRKTVDATEEKFAELEQGIRDLSKAIPASAAEIAGVAEVAGQLGIAADNLLEFSKTAIALGETTNLSAEEAATSLAQLANVTQLPQKEIGRLGAALVDLGNKGTSTERDILDLSLRFAGAGKIAGLAQDEILGIGAAFANVGVDAEAGGTAIQKVLLTITQAVNSGNEDLAKFADVAGVSVAEFSRLFREDAAGAFTAFVDGLAASGQAAGVVLDDLGLADQRLISAFLRVAGAGDELTRSIEQGGQAFEANTALTDEFAKRLDTNAAKLEILSNKFADAKITIGGTLASVLLPVLETFGDLPGPIVAVGAALAGLAAGALAVGLLAEKVKLANIGLQQMGSFGATASKSLGLIGKASIAVGVLTAIKIGVEALSKATMGPPAIEKSLEGLAGALVDLGEAGTTGSGLNTDGLEALNDIIEEAEIPLDLFHDSLIELGDALGKTDVFGGIAQESFSRIDEALAKLVEGGALETAQKAAIALDRAFGLTTAQSASLPLVKYRDAVHDAGGAAKVAAAAQKEQAGAISKVGKAYDEATEDIDAWSESLERSLGIVIGSQQAHSDYQEALDTLDASLKENGVTLKASTERGRENRQNLIDLVEAGQQRVESLALEAQVAGESFDKQGALNEILEKLKRKYPELRGAIDVYATAVQKADDKKIENPVTTPGMTKALTALDKLKIKLGDVGGIGLSILANTPTIDFTVSGRGTSPSFPLYVKTVGGATSHGGGWLGGINAGAFDIPITAQGGEFMLRRSSAGLTSKAFGPGFLSMWNQASSVDQLRKLFGGLKFHSGGAVPQAFNVPSAAPIVMNNTFNIVTPDAQDAATKTARTLGRTADDLRRVNGRG